MRQMSRAGLCLLIQTDGSKSREGVFWRVVRAYGKTVFRIPEWSAYRYLGLNNWGTGTRENAYFAESFRKAGAK